MTARPRHPTLAAWALLWLGLAAGSTCATVFSVSVQGSDGQPLADAVVAVLIKGVPSTAPAGTRAQVAQKDRQFQPQLAVVQTGTAVWFPNFDTVRHHVYSFSPIQRFELRLYAGTPTHPVVFDKPGVAVLGCNIHDRMQATVVVVDTPHFARTDATGLATLELPAGEHRLHVWHAALGETATPLDRALTVGATPGRVSINLARREAP